MRNISLTAGMRQNLYSLQSTAQLMDQTAGRLSSGKKVETALDDPINYFAAEGHRQRASDLTARKDEMGEAVQTVKAGNIGIESLVDLVASAKSLVNSALSADSSADIKSLESQYNILMTQIDELALDSGYKGINLLDGTDDELKVSFDEKGDASVTLTGFDASHEGLSLTTITEGSWVDGGTAGAVDAKGDKSNLNEALDRLDSARSTLRDESKKLANNLSTITIRQDFTSNMIRTLEDGADNLTLADMNEEGANMLMLQTRQGLGTSSLSMASQAAQSVLRLF
ncbi:MAG TPA: flagellin [Proteobacteria bacterium]|nr:flagellin [Pseudomonadota bacterium]